MIGALLTCAMFLHGGSHVGPWAPPDPAAELDRLQAAAAAAPESAVAQRALGLLLARDYATPDAIPVLERAIALDALGSDEARMWIPFLLVEAGRDRDAVDACQALRTRWPTAHPLRASIDGLLGSIAQRHAALATVTASETRAIIAIVLAFGAMGAGWFLGRRYAARTLGAA